MITQWHYRSVLAGLWLLHESHTNSLIPHPIPMISVN